MPIAPKTICQHCRRTGCECRKRVRREQQEQYDQQRGTAAQRGYDATWVAFREAFIGGETEGRSNSLCWDCLDEGIVKRMKELHHVVKVADDPSRRLDEANVRPLCKRHHSIRTAKGE